MQRELDLSKFPTPRLRADLVLSSSGPGAGSNLTIKDPQSGRFYRFGPAEAFILEQFDGGADLQQIRQKVIRKFKANLDTTTLARFVVSLETRGLLQFEGADRPAGEPKPRSLKGSLLYLRYPLHNPDRRLINLNRRLGWLFTRPFLWASAAVVLVAIGVFIANLAEIKGDIFRALDVSLILPAWLVILVTTVGHEYAHGLTCKHFGGEVREMGVMLLFFQPALYADVSDCWLFPEKYKRIAVTLAGTLFEFVLWALAVLIWRIAAPETKLNLLALIIIATSGVRLFLNLNPLIKLDGYYALSDWLEIPNLRSKAISYVRSRIRHPGAPIDADLGLRERRIYLIYGLLGGGFSIWLLSYITFSLAAYLTDNFQAFGFLGFTALLAIVFWKPMRRAMRLSSAETGGKND